MVHAKHTEVCLGDHRFYLFHVNTVYIFVNNFCENDQTIFEANSPVHNNDFILLITL